MKNRIEKYGFIENQDYETCTFLNTHNQQVIDYALSIDCDKLNESYNNGGMPKIRQGYIFIQTQEVNSIEKCFSPK